MFVNFNTVRQEAISFSIKLRIKEIVTAPTDCTVSSKIPWNMFRKSDKKKKNQNKLVDLGGVKVPLKLDILDLI